MTLTELSADIEHLQQQADEAREDGQPLAPLSHAMQDRRACR